MLTHLEESDGHLGALQVQAPLRVQARLESEASDG